MNRTIQQQQQILENAIETLNSTKLSIAKTFKAAKIIIGTMEDYIANPEILPEERFIPCCLFVVPIRLSQALAVSEGDCLRDYPQKMGHRLLLRNYLKLTLKLLQQSSEEIKHMVVESMSRSMGLLMPFEPIAKKWLKNLIQTWAASAENLNLSLRCHMAVSKYLKLSLLNSEDTYMWALRRVYVNYFSNCKQVSWRNLEHINFMINSFCELARLNPDRACYVMFGYLRSIALELDKLNKSKRKEKVDLTNKLFSYQILNCFKLLMAVVARVEGEEMTSLIYPLCELIANYERISESAQFLPLKLHILDYELEMSDNLNIYIPHTLELIVKLMHSSVFSRKLKKKSEKVEANLQLGYRISKEELSQAALINQIFTRLLTRIYYFEKIVSGMVCGAEIMQKLAHSLKNHTYAFSEYKINCSKVVKHLKEDAQELYELRCADSMRINDNRKIHNFETACRAHSNKLKGVYKYQELKEQEEELLKRKLAAENDQELAAQQVEKPDSDQDQDDELNSGWEEASQGASSFEQLSSGEKVEESVEDVSYEGDPDDADDLIQQWSEEQWDSQDHL